MLFNLAGWAHRRFARTGTRSSRPPRRRLDVESLEERTLLSTNLPINAATWTSLIPGNLTPANVIPNTGPLTGRVTAIAADQNDPGRIFVGSAGGGLWQSTNGGVNWTSLTHNLPAGNSSIGAIALDPDNPQIIYAGTGEANHVPGSVFFFFGDNSDSYAGRGLLKSVDGGQTWEVLAANTFSGNSFADIVVDPQDSNTLFAAVTQGTLGRLNGGGVYRSFDAGVTWTNITAPALAETLAFTSLALDPQNGALFIGVGTPGGDNQNGVYRTFDPKQPSPNFTLVTGLPSGANVGRISLDTSARGAVSMQWALISDTSGNLLAVGQTTNGSSLWTDVTARLTGSNVDGLLNVGPLGGAGTFTPGAGNYASAVAVDPRNPFTVFLGGADGAQPVGGGGGGGATNVPLSVIRSVYSTPPAFPGPTNLNWLNYTDVPAGNTTVNPYQHAMAVAADGSLYVGNDAGLWHHNNDPLNPTWNNRNTGLDISQFSSIALVPNNADKMFAAVKSAGIAQFADGAGQTPAWTEQFFLTPGQLAFQADAGSVIVDPRDPRFVYAYVATPNPTDSFGFDFVRSADGGQTWSSQSTGLGLSDFRGTSFPLVLDVPAATATHRPRLLLGTDRIYVNYTPQGANTTWSTLNNAVFTGAQIHSIASSPSTSGVIYISVGSFLFATRDDGFTWTDITPRTVPPRTLFTQVIVDPNNAQTVYAVTPNGGASRIFLSTNGGTSWTETSSNLPAGTRPWAMTVVPARAGAAITGTGTGYTVGDVLTVQGGTTSTNPPQPTTLTVTSIVVEQASLVSGGNGYRVGDVLTVAGGASSAPAQISVTAIVGGGQSGPIAGFTLSSPGSYTLTPPNPVSVLGGAGASGATFNLRGAINGASIQPGIYSTQPANPVSVQGGTGQGARFTVTPEIQLLGTDAGVFFSNDRGAAWQLVGAGLPNVQVRQLQYDPFKDTLAVATYGRGVWAINLQSGATIPPPVVAAPASAATGTNAPITFTNISVADPAVGTNTMQITLTATSGTMSISNRAGLAFSAGTGIGDRTMTFTAPIQTLNNALSSLTYTPDVNYTGPDSLTIIANDLGHTGGVLTPPQQTVASIAISVNTIQLVFDFTFTTAAADQDLPEVRVNVIDAQGAPVPFNGLPVTLSASTSAGPATLSGTRTVQTQAGVASFTDLALRSVDTYTLTATAPGVTNPIVSGPISITAGTPAQLNFTQGPPATATAGTPLPDVKVSIADAFGNSIATGSIQVTLGVAPQTTPPVAVTADTVNGTATFSGVTINAVGSYVLTASATGPTGPLQGASDSFTVNSASSATLAFAGDPADSVAGVALGAVRLELRDQFGNLVTGSTDVTVSANGPGPLKGQGVNNGSVTVTASNGVAILLGLVLERAGPYTLTATATGLAPAVTGTFDISAAAANRVAFITTGQPPSFTAGLLAPPVRVQVLDAFDNIVADSAALVKVSASGPGALSGATTVQAINGVATFNSLVLQQAGSYTFDASSNMLAGAPPLQATVVAAAPAQLRFTAAIADSSTLQPIPAFSVELLDAFGNVATGATDSVTIAADGPGGFSAGTATVTPVDGLATFSDLVLGTAGSYTLSATAASLQPAASSSFTITQLVASRLEFAGPIADAVAGTALADVMVNVLDQFGNPFTANPVAVTLGATGPGALSGTTTVQALGGVATFAGLSLVKSGAYTLNANAAGLTPGVSNSFAISAAAAATLAFKSPLTGAGAGILPPIEVNLFDAYGNLASGSTASIDIAAAGPGPLGGTTTVQASGGSALFSDLTLSTLGSYTLTAASAGLASVTTPAFTLVAGAPARLELGQVSGTAVAGQVLAAITVRVTDAGGNPVSSDAAVTLSAAGGQSVIGTTTVRAVNGVATFTNVSIATAGNVTLVASAAALAPAQSSAVSVAAGAAARLSFLAFPTTRSAGQALTELRVQVLDAFGNAVATSGNQVSLSAIGPGPISGGSMSAPVINGVATFVLVLFTKPGNYILAANAPGLAGASSPTLTVTSGSPSQLVWVTTPSGSTVGQSLPALQVAVFDAFGNPVTDPNALVTVSSSGALAGTATAPVVNGFATFNNLALVQSGTFTFTASTATGASVTTAPFVVNPRPATPARQTVSRLRYLSAPTRAVRGRTFVPVRVQLLDASGRAVRRANVIVRLRLAGGRLSGRLQVRTDARGIATFSNLRSTSIGRFRLIASSAGVRLAISRIVTITAPLATRSARL